MKRYLVAIFLVVATLWCDAVAKTREKQEKSPPAFVDENGDGIDDRVTFFRRQSRRLWGSALLWVLSARLTEVQRTALQSRINELLAEGAKASEVKRAIFALLEGFGVDLTETFLAQLDAILTKDQMFALRKKAEDLKASGVTHSEIYKVIRDELAGLGLGVEKKKPDHLGALLTEGQMLGLQQKIDKLIADGASRVEIQKAIHAELEVLGIDMRVRGKKRALDFWRKRHRSRASGGVPPPRPPDREKDKSGKKGQ